MTKANEIRPGQLPSQQAQLNQVEQAKVRQQQAKKMTAQDAARIASQAGFARATGRKRKGLDIGDSSKAPIPLPDDDVDAEVWSQERLDEAQESLTLAGDQLREVQHEGAEASMAEALVGSSFLPTEQDVQRMEALAAREAPEPVPLDDAQSNVERLFNIPLGDEEVPVGHKVVAVGLVVAGETESVEVDKGGLNEQKLAGGVQKVTEKSNQAVGEAQRMSKGIHRELSVQRTFVFKR